MALTPTTPPLRPRQRGWRPDEIADSFLLADEKVLLNEHQSLRAWLLGQVPLALGGVVVVLVLWWVLGGASAALASVVLLALAVVIAGRAFEASYTRYVITDMRVLRVSGVMNRNVEFIPWKKVTDVSRRESVFQWMVGSATIRIESANERSAFREMTDVHRPERFYRLLVTMVDRHNGRVAVEGIDPGDLED